jgi:hypothetical protein
MSILTANLKHFYQRRALWLFYFFGLSYALLCLLKGQRISLLFLAFGVGTVLGSCQREVMSRPFAFLLPRHAWLVPRLALSQSAFVGGIVGLCWLAMPGATWPHPLIGVLLGTSCCLLGTLLGFALPYLAPALLGFLPMILMLTALSRDALAADRALQIHALWAGLAALAAIAWAWHRLSRRDLPRHCQTVHSLFMFEAFDLAKVNQYQRWRHARRASAQSESAGTALAQACVRGIRRSQPEGLRRYLYAVCARLFGNLSARQMGNLMVPMLAVVPILVYSGQGAACYFVVFPAMLIRGVMFPQLTPFLPVGRRQRRVQANMHLLALFLLATVLALVMVLATQLAAPWMPTLSPGRISLSPRPLPLLYALLPACGLPLAYAIHVWCRKRFALAALFWLVPLLILTMVLVQIPSRPSPLVWLAILSVSLLLGLGLLHYHFQRRDLA